ncbi:ATP-binding protein [Actinomadura alba]
MGNGMTRPSVPHQRARCAITLRAAATAVPAARAYVRVTLETWGVHGLADNAETVVSELVTNAVRHARDTVTLTCSRPAAGRFVLEVWDPSADLPEMGVAGPLDVHGRGLVIVAALADEWGAHHVDDGKVVWAAFAT